MNRDALRQGLQKLKEFDIIQIYYPHHHASLAECAYFSSYNPEEKPDGFKVYKSLIDFHGPKEGLEERFIEVEKVKSIWLCSRSQRPIYDRGK